ncbi:MAG: hypothetical protein J0G94_03545 [Sphingomonadales bacterium]|nr:hypothetical protein [Sphingomonadales bacterium]
MSARKIALPLLLLTGTLAGCGGEPEANNATAVAEPDANISQNTADNASDNAPRNATTPAATEQAIPAAFQGRWSRSAATCGKPGDDMRLAISGDSLIFYESVGKVTSVKTVSPGHIEVRADYNGEGDRWSDVTSLLLSEDGQTLTIGEVKRVRCA